MRALLYFLRETYYVPLIMLLLCLITATIGYRNRHRFTYLKLFPIYALASALQVILTFFIYIFQPSSFLLIVNTSIIIFVSIEFFIFFNLLSQLIKNRYFKRSMAAMQFSFILFSVFVWLNFKTNQCLPLSFNIVNSTCLIIPCLFYFYELFKAPPTISLSAQPAFWVIIGFSFMAICSIPFYLLENYFYNNMPDFYNQVCTLNYVFYCLVFILISKAFLCKPAVAR
jgi:hypothetical protein